MSKKIYELAKELEMGPLDLVESLKLNGFNIRNHMQELSEEEILTYLNTLENKSGLTENLTDITKSHSFKDDLKHFPTFLIYLDEIFSKAWDEDCSILTDTKTDTLVDKKGQTPLHYLARSKKREVISNVLTHPSIDKVHESLKGNTPLHYIASSKCFELIDLAFNHPSFGTIKNHDSETPLHIVAGSNYYSTLEKALNHEFIDRVKNNLGETPLHILSKSKCIDFIPQLLKHPSIDLTVDHNHETPLHYLARLFRNDSAISQQILLHSSIDLAKDKNNETPLHYLASSYQDDIIKKIYNHISMDKVRDKKGNTPFHILINNLSITKEAIYHPSVDKIPNNEGNTPLHYVRDIHKINTLPTSWYELKNNEGNTPFHCLALRLSSLSFLPNFENLVESIFGIEELTSIKNSNGDTPLHIIAEKAKSIFVAEKIINHPNVLDSINNNGETAIHLLCKIQIEQYKEDGLLIPYDSREAITKFMELNLKSKPSLNSIKDNQNRVPLDSILIFHKK